MKPLKTQLEPLGGKFLLSFAQLPEFVSLGQLIPISKTCGKAARVNGILYGALLDTQAVKFEVYCQHLLDGKDFLPILQCDLFLDVWSKLQRSC